MKLRSIFTVQTSGCSCFVNTWSLVCRSVFHAVKLASQCGESGKFQRQDHIPVSAQHLLTDAGPFFLKGALLGKSPSPLELLIQTLPALDEALICLLTRRSRRSCGEDNTLLSNAVIFKSLTTHTDRACLQEHVFAHLSPLLISFLTLQMQPGVLAHHRPPW